MQYDVNNGLLQVVIEGEEINAVVGEAAQIDVGEAINYIQSGTAEIEQAVQEGITQFNGNATEKTNEFDLNAQNKTSDFNSNATQKTLDFNSNASDKTSEFNLNAQDKTSDFNANAVEKTNDFNLNAQDKTGDFNDNAVNKTNDFNDNATDKTGDFNDNASDKTSDFNLNAQNKTSDFNDNYTEKKGLIDAQVVIAEGAATTATNQAGLAKQWAIGDPSEPTGNSAKYWATQASSSATAAATSEDHAEVWAEGTDQEVQALGGVHSSKGWAAESAAGQINSNWTENDPTSKAYILNKPTAGDNISLANNQISAVSDASPTQYSTKLVQSGGVFTATNNLQTQIDAIVSSSDVFDIVGTYAELQAYDITTVPVNDIIKVLVDSTHSNAATYYRCVESGGVKSWSYIGSEGAYYTKAEADNKFSTITGTGSALDYTGTTLSLQNSSGTTLSSVTIQSSPDIDGKSITKNSSNELQTVGVINQNNTAQAVKTWTGTKAQYDAIVTKDVNTQYMITDTGEIYLGSTLLSNYGADTSLSNLTSTGKNIANWSNNVTNCITEIPQDIKLELNNGTLTLKAGSKVYNGNGLLATTSTDLQATWATTGTAYISVTANGQHLYVCNYPGETVSSLPSPTTSYKLYYNTTDGKCYFDTGSWEEMSFPIAIVSATGQISNIDQVFNGFGYIGSTKFLLPMKGVGTVGKNPDGTYHTVAWEINQVYTETMSSDITGTYWQGFDLFSDGSMAYFGTYVSRNIISPTKPTYTNIIWTNPINGYTYYIDNNGDVGTTPYMPIRFALQSLSSGKVTSWSVINNTFTALNYWDKPTISGWSMPSSKHIDLTILASGSTYTAPANGWFAVLQVQSNTGYCNMYSNSGIGFMYYGNAGMPLKASIPVKKGDIVTYDYTNVSSVEFLYFIYAEGENA